MGSNTHLMKDPVFGTIEFNDQEYSWIKPFIDSKNMQRLRFIKQLGMTFYIFPGAIHTRFDHSIGSCYIAAQIAKNLKLTLHEKRLVMIAALLHDIGHGPFSHLFENIYPHVINHEMWIPIFLREYRDEKFLSKYNSQITQKEKLTENFFIEIEEIITHKRQNFLSDLISSHLDVDRLDYLLRDNYFCGVSYGKYDFSWIIKSLVVVNYQKSRRLGITNKGIGAVEQYLAARRLMTNNVYTHKKKRAMEFYLQEFLRCVAKLAYKNPQKIRSSLFHKIKSFLAKLYEFNLFIKSQKNRDLKLMMKNFIAENYDNFKSFDDLDVWMLVRYFANSDEKNSLCELASRLNDRKLPYIFAVSEDRLLITEKIFRDWQNTYLTSYKSWQISFFVISYLSHAEYQSPILLKKDNGEVNYLHTESEIVNLLENENKKEGLIIIDQAIVKETPALKLISSLNDSNALLSKC